MYDCTPGKDARWTFYTKTENRLYRIPEEHAFGELRGWDPSASVLVLFTV